MKKFNVYKKKLSNGLTVLVRPVHTIPEVAVQLWYNVGSKDEESKERGMAHLIEHMIFKGTKKLSEIDIDLITCKLCGYANAFTSNDYTTYVFKFPTNVWQESLMILSDCMQNARFEEQMLNSELHAVVQELKLYKDDYQEVLIERMMSGMFPQHPYHHPIIGYKHDLLDLQRDNLYKFYKKHYHPANATLVIVGDVDKDEAFAQAEKNFSKLASPKDYKKINHAFTEDIYNVSVRLPREVENPWAFYAFRIPGATAARKYLFDILVFLLGRGRSSRLYEKLVNEEKLATAVGCFSYDLYEKSLFYIYVQPVNVELLPRIEALIDQELKFLAENEIEEWEFRCVKKKAEMSYCMLLESMERQAELIGHSFLATGDTGYIDSYMEGIQKTKRSDIQKAVKEFLRSELRNNGYLLPSNDSEKSIWHELQKKSDALDLEILKKRQRTSKVEGGKFIQNVKEKELPEFTYPVPKTFVLDNGLEVVFHHNPSVPKVSVLLGLKADYLHELAEQSGMSTFMSRLLLEGTTKYSAKELNQYLESEGIYVSVSSGVIGLELLSKDLCKGLDILAELVTEPAFREESIEKVRQLTLMELQEFWDTPTVFVDTLARQIVYKGHPYSKNRLGHKECIQGFTREKIFDFYKNFVTPEEAVLVIVGDLGSLKESDIQHEVSKSLGSWKGKQVSDLLFPDISYDKPQVMHHKINRDQMVLAFAAPSVSRLDNNFDALSVLDFILTGSGITTTSRLYQLREQTGMFYTIGGSLVYGAGRAPGMIFIKTVVSLDKVAQAEQLIRKTIKNLQEKGISQTELAIATRSLMTASVRIFENNARVAKTFLFFKRCGISLDLFDKRGALLSILKIDAVNNVAHRYCKEKFLSTLLVGRESG